LLSVKAEEEAAHYSRKLVIQRGGRWQLANNDLHERELLTYQYVKAR